MNEPRAGLLCWPAPIGCAVAEIGILRSTLAERGGTASKAELVPTASRGGELAWAVVPAVGLCVVFAFTWQRISAREGHMRMMDHSSMATMPMSLPQPRPPYP